MADMLIACFRSKHAGQLLGTFFAVDEVFTHGQTIGMIAFGPETYSAYGQFLDARTQISLHPLLTMYAMMWVIIVPVIWHILAIWQKMLLSVYLGTGIAWNPCCLEYTL